jgi:hypothetical protein
MVFCFLRHFDSFIQGSYTVAVRHGFYPELLDGFIHSPFSMANLHEAAAGAAHLAILTISSSLPYNSPILHRFLDNIEPTAS